MTILLKPLFKKSLFGLICLLFISWSVSAQDTPSNNTWSLEQCVQYAIKNNVSVMQSDLQVQVSENNYLQSKVSRYPDLNAGANQNFNWGRSIDPFTNQFVNQRISSNNFSLNSSLTLFDGFSISNTIKRNQIDVEVDRLTAQQSRNDVSLNVALGYLNILLNKELLSVAEQNVLSTQAQLDRTQKLFDAGAVAENDVIDLKATLSNNELAVVNAKNQLQISYVTLQQLMNLPVTLNFEVREVSIEALDVINFSETADQIYQTALTNQPNIRSAERNEESAAYSIDIAKSGSYPTLTLSGSIFTGYSSATTRDGSEFFNFVDTVGFVDGNTSVPVTSERSFALPEKAPFFDQLGDNFRQQISLSLNIPIFNRWQVKNQVNNAVINKKSAELSTQNLKNQLRQTIEQAYVDAQSALNTYQARQKQVEALELSYETTEKRYNAGAANVVDFNLARINRDNARSDAVRAKYDYLFRKKVLDFYLGRDLSID
ncbi:MAG: TolC family protein [Microscillaceae bacterium]|nr:TolC family protein [Microscillaceae bacterium]